MNVVNFVLGYHPISNTSYVTGVGANSQLISYGFNRDEYSYIPGGVIPDVSFMQPGFMDLKNFAYGFNQTEYISTAPARMSLMCLPRNGCWSIYLPENDIDSACGSD